MVAHNSILLSDGYEPGMMMDNDMSPEYEHFNGNPEYMMQGGYGPPGSNMGG